MTKYMEQHIVWTNDTGDLKEMFVATNPMFFVTESGT